MRYKASKSSKVALFLGLPMMVYLILPVIALIVSSSFVDLTRAMTHPLFLGALGVSVKTTCVATLFVVVFGMPLAWWLSLGQNRIRRLVLLLVDLPIVLPPAVVGIALLQAFGRQGLMGSTLQILGVHIAFSWIAVVMAQVIVSAPFFIHSATQHFALVDEDAVLVAQSLGASALGAFLRVTVPVAAPGLLAGLAIAWARALGEFGATLIFAGNQPGQTQTMPLAIYTAMEVDVGLSIALSVVLGFFALGALIILRKVTGGLSWMERANQ